MMKVCFNGCSLTAGEGFPLDQRHSIYDRLVITQCEFSGTNIAKNGSSNHEIFMRSALALQHDFDIVFVQWSALNRLWLRPGPDVEWFLNDGRETFHYRELHLDKYQKKQFEQTILLMNHDYGSMIELIDCCSILDRLAKYHAKTVIYINGLVPWTNDLNFYDESDQVNSLSDYSKRILDAENRDDVDVKKFFLRLQKKFQTLDQSRWVNLFDSFAADTVDNGPEGHHPGTRSHKIMADKILNYLKHYALIDQ